MASLPKRRHYSHGNPSFPFPGLNRHHVHAPLRTTNVLILRADRTSGQTVQRPSLRRHLRCATPPELLSEGAEGRYTVRNSH